MQALNVTLQFVQIKNRFENRSKQSTFGLLSPNFYKHLSVFQLNPIKRETTLRTTFGFSLPGPEIQLGVSPFHVCVVLWRPPSS